MFSVQLQKRTKYRAHFTLVAWTEPGYVEVMSKISVKLKKNPESHYFSLKFRIIS